MNITSGTTFPTPTIGEPAAWQVDFRRSWTLDLARLEMTDEKGSDDADLDDFDEEDFDDEFDDDFEEELDDEYDLLDAEVTEEDLAEDDEADVCIGGEFVDEDEDAESPGKGAEPAEED